MRLISITLSGYRQFREPVSLTFPNGLTGICGVNGVGKSKLVEAVGYALYGPCSRLLPSGDSSVDLPSRPEAAGSPVVTLTIEIGDQQFEITRSTARRKCVIRIVSDNTILAETPKGINDKVVELLRLSSDAFLGTFVARQREVALLQASPTAERQKQINRLIGVSLVEKALELVQRRREESKRKYETEQAAAGDSIANIQARLSAHQTSLAEAEASAAKTIMARDTAAQGLQQVVNEKQRALQQLEEYGNKEKELASIDEQVITLETTLEVAQSQLDALKEAEEKTTSAKAILTGTEHIADLIAMHEKRAGVARLREKLAAQESRLVSIHPQLQERTNLFQKLERVGKTVNAQKIAFAEQDAKLQGANQARKVALEEEDRQATRMRNVRQIGAQGVCDTCGQSLGGSLEQMLAHLAQEKERAIAQRKKVEDEIKDIAAVKVDLELQSTSSQEEHRTLDLQWHAYDQFEKEQIQIEGLIEECQEQISGLPESERMLLYEAHLHAEAIQEAERRRQAESDIASYTTIIVSASNSHQRHAMCLGQLHEKRQQRTSLLQEIARLRPDPAHMVYLEQVYQEAHAAYENADVACRQTAEQVVAAKIRIEESEGELKRAEAQWERVAATQRQLSVAQSTEDLIQRLLTEITAEACPRITELMEGWARSLMGPHFKRIELTSDYRIKADNGSGLHQIDHFSGGEQTLLAVMLRVAISIYCQERAGYPTGFLILDEVFGDQDETHRTQLVQFLNEIKPHYHQIIIVNHVADVTGMLDNIIEVTRTKEQSSTAVLLSP